MPFCGPKPLKPRWSTTDGDMVRLYQGNCIDVLNRLPAESVQMVVTSPPYWGLRDYGTNKSLEIGSEKTPEEFVAKMVEVFRAIRRVLRNDGTVWLNLGDTFCGGSRGLPPGNLVGIPWRVALALQADGWILRQDIIWHKPAPMPESVTNRCTKAHEYLFLLVKQKGYFYDADAIKERSKQPKEARQTGKQKKYLKLRHDAEAGLSRHAANSTLSTNRDPTLSNKRSVWTIAGQGYSGAHFATYPPKLIEPCILAGTSAWGACIKCRAPWKRLISLEGGETVSEDERAIRDSSMRRNRNGVTGSLDGKPREVKTMGWGPTCNCGCTEVRPCIVLDPFIGSGTTAEVAINLGRHCWGIDLSERYIDYHAIKRIQKALRADGLGDKAGRVVSTALEAKRVI